MEILMFNKWLNENQRPLIELSDLDVNRRYKGTQYEYELFPRFRRLQVRIDSLEKRPNLSDWFKMMQNSDAEFYTLIQARLLGQPDVRELWRDLTSQRSSRMKKYNLAENIEP